jgi:GT2 family glycosyltransferase
VHHEDFLAQKGFSDISLTQTERVCMAEKILAIVVTYNRLALLKQCLQHLQASRGPAFDILAVDNASTDGSGAWLDERQSENQLQVLHLPSNTGGAGGFSAGVRQGVEQGFTRLWLMDDDTMVQPDALKELDDADTLLHGNFGFLSSAVLWKDETECRMNRVKLKKAYYEKLELLKDGLILAEHATFVSMYLNAEAVKAAGLPIRQYFIWGDDIEYSMRLSHRYPCYLTGRSRVQHWMQENVGSSIALDDASKLSRYHYAFRNDGCTYRKYGFSGVCYYIGKCGINIGRIIAHAKDHRWRRIGIVLGGMIASWFFHPRVEFAGVKNKEEER